MNKINIENGGKDSIERMLKAYNFKTRSQLAERTGTTNSTLGTWWNRDYFPAALVIQCALDTGVNLEWLVSGKGEIHKDQLINTINLDCSKIEKGQLIENGGFSLDKSFLPENLNEPKVIISNATKYIVDYQFDDITSGSWLVDIEGEINIKQLEKIPIKRLRVSGEDHQPFECAIDDITIVAKVVMVCK